MVKSKEMQSKYIKRRFGNLIFLAGTLLTVGITLLFTHQWLFSFILNKGLAVKEGSPAFYLWQKNPMPLYLDFYFFNWTNPQDLYNSSVKPRFIEVGPVRYEETKEKVNITWNKNETVTFRHKKTWFVDKTSPVKANENITTINPVSVSAAFTVRDWNFWLKKGFHMSLSILAPKLEITKTAGQFTFEGYNDPLVNLKNQMTFSDDGSPKLDKFGWFYKRNNSELAEGLYNMGLGANDWGRIYTWNNANETGYYEKPCDKVFGSAGEFYTRKSNKRRLAFFNSDLCRTLELDFEKEVEIGGIIGHKYSFLTTFDNGTLYPENKCFCNGECVPSGVLNVSSCKFNTPSYASLPHFYLADPDISKDIEGMEPDEKKHEFYIVVEPTTGIPLDVAARLQVNFLLRPIKYLRLYENVPRLFFPLFWFEQRAQIPYYLLISLKILLFLPIFFQVLGYCLIVLGIFILTYIFYKPLTQIITQKNKEEIKDLESIKESEPLNGYIGEKETQVGT